MTYKLVPPEDHQRNLCKQSIGTFKDHFIGVLSGRAKEMPMHLWCQLLPQVERQLLLLQQSRVNPGMLAYAHVYQGQHSNSKHPFVPIGIKSLMHVNHTNNEHTHNTAKRIRNRDIVIKGTHSTCVLGTVWFKHKYLTNPAVTPEDQIVAAIGGLAKTLNKKIPTQL